MAKVANADDRHNELVCQWYHQMGTRLMDVQALYDVSALHQIKLLFLLHICLVPSGLSVCAAYLVRRSQTSAQCTGVVGMHCYVA